MKGRLLVNKLPEIFVTLKETWTATNKCFTVFWLAVFLACLVVMIVEMVYLCMDFLEYPTDTNIQVEPQQSIKYPYLVLCATHPINYTRISGGLQNNDDLINYIYTSMFVDGIPTPYTDKQMNAFDQAYANIMKRNYSMRTTNGFFRKYGLNCQNVFKLCSSQHEQFDCCSKQTLFSKFFTGYGQCFMMRPPKINDRQRLPGKRGSLRFVVGRDIYFGANYTKPSEELLWSLHYVSPNYRTTGESDIDFSPTLVRPGHRTQVRLKPVRYTLLGSPYSPDCINGVMRRPASKAVPYQVEYCFRECEAAITMRECGCIRLGTILYPDPNRPICTPEQSHRCAHYAADRMQCDCPMSCKYIAYNPTKDISPLPTNWAEHITQLGYKLGHVATGEQICIIDVYYSALVRQTMIQVPKWTVTTILGSIGGQCSLWLGIRIFTIIQLVFYLMLSCCSTNDDTEVQLSTSTEEKRRRKLGLNRCRPAAVTSPQLPVVIY